MYYSVEYHYPKNQKETFCDVCIGPQSDSLRPFSATFCTTLLHFSTNFFHIYLRKTLQEKTLAPKRRRRHFSFTFLRKYNFLLFCVRLLLSLPPLERESRQRALSSQWNRESSCFYYDSTNFRVSQNLNRKYPQVNIAVFFCYLS